MAKNKNQIEEILPFKLLKYGIENGDWESVAEAYKLLTGVTIKPSQKLDKNGIEDAISILQKYLMETKIPEHKVRKTERVENIGYIPTNKELYEEGKSGPPWITGRKIKPITFTPDKIDIQNENKTKTDIKKGNRVKREKIALINVLCSKCNKTQNIHPMFAKENYVCDSCIGKLIK